MQVHIKEELSKLDRNDFQEVCKLVDRIVEDIWTTADDDDSLHGRSYQRLYD